MEWFGDMHKVFNESLVEIDKAEELLKIIFAFWFWPFCDSGDFDWVHGDLTISDNKSEVFYLRLFKFTFLRFEV
jgi:hypothetical protein